VRPLLTEDERERERHKPDPLQQLCDSLVRAAIKERHSKGMLAQGEMAMHGWGARCRMRRWHMGCSAMREGGASEGEGGEGGRKGRSVQGKGKTSATTDHGFVFFT